LAYNPIWDVKKRIPLFTKRKKSRCWFAAGWYKIYQKDQWQIVQNPKLISIKRNRYLGPYHDKQSASLAEAQSIEDTL
jgi:putative SOS response-associated peptidase YedK